MPAGGRGSGCAGQDWLAAQDRVCGCAWLRRERGAEVRELAAEGKLEWVERAFEPADLDGNFMVIAATDVPEVNAAVYREAVARGIPCNSVDDIPNCDFFFGSVVNRGELQIAISTAGESPAVAQRLRREIDEQLPEDLGPWLARLGRAAARSAGDSRTRRRTQVAAARTGAETNLRFGACARQNSWRGRAGKRRAAAGTAYLVGAGPGDPELLTVKALRLIESADVVLHDDLVPQAILDLAAAGGRGSERGQALRRTRPSLRKRSTR